jgi:hypothetical protein
MSGPGFKNGRAVATYMRPATMWPRMPAIGFPSLSINRYNTATKKEKACGGGIGRQSS